MPSFRSLSRQFGGFLAVGLANLALTLLVYEALILVMPYWLAYTLSFAVGIAFALFANAGLVFGRPVSIASAVPFVLFYLVSYAAGLGIVVLLVEAIRIPAGLAPFGAIAILVPINFIGTRFVLERDRS
jgi:putative flippase GtrA